MTRVRGNEQRVNRNNQDMVRVTLWLPREQVCMLQAIREQCDISIAKQCRRALGDWILRCRDAALDRKLKQTGARVKARRVA